MDQLLSLLTTIPGVIWSGVVGAGLALCGVLISNRSNTSRLRIQLEHDAKEKGKERTATLRRDIYQRTAEELVKANVHLASLPNLDPAKVNIGEGLQGFFSAAARLQLVAEPKTALLVNQLVGEYGELFLDLMADLSPAHSARTDIQIADAHYEKAQGEVTRILGEMVKQNESGKPDAAVFSALQAQFDFQQAQSAKFAAMRDDGWSRFNSASVAFQRSVIARLVVIAPKQIPVLIELRRDLGLDGDLGELEAQIRRQMQRMQDRLNAFIEKLSGESA
jgi:hypothetical protein